MAVLFNPTFIIISLIMLIGIIWIYWQKRAFILMLRQLGYEVGLSNSEAEEFASYAQSIISATTLRPPGGRRGPSGTN